MMTIKLTGLESDLKIQQQVLASDTCCNNISLLCISEPVFLACGLQKNSSLEKQLEDSDHNSKKVRKRKVISENSRFITSFTDWFAYCMIRYAAELLGQSLLNKLMGQREFLKTGQIAFIIEFLLTISVQNVFFFFL